MLKRLGIVKSRTRGYEVFTNYIEPNFMNNTMSPSEYVNYCWQQYELSGIPRNNSLNGTIFELIIASLLVKEGILPLHLQANVAFVPNVNFDAVLYTSESGPIGLSLKTSLRERYKQADLEAVALKYVHRKAENYLLTMDPDEAESVSRKISDGAVLGLDKAILATSPSFDEFVELLKNRTFISPGQVEIITASRVITEESVTAVLGTTV